MGLSKVKLAALAAPLSGKVTVASAGTNVPLSAVPVVIASVTVKALAANTGTIYVGPKASASASAGFQLAKSESCSLDVGDLSLVYVDASVNGEGVTYLAVVDD